MKVYEKRAETNGNESPEQREQALYDALLALRTPGECRNFLIDICTKQEIGDLAERWLIARLLGQGCFSYREISAITGASTTTVGRVARFLNRDAGGGYRLVLDRLKKAGAVKRNKDK